MKTILRCGASFILGAVLFIGDDPALVIAGLLSSAFLFFVAWIAPDWRAE